MDDELSPKEQNLIKTLAKKHAFEIARLKQSGLENDPAFGPAYFKTRNFLHSLLVVELQESVTAAIESFAEQYEDILPQSTINYVIGSNCLQYFSGMVCILMEEHPLMADDLISECAMHYDDLCEEMGITDLLKEVQNAPLSTEETPAQQLRAALTLVKKEDPSE